jgi:hypothetical protein
MRENEAVHSCLSFIIYIAISLRCLEICIEIKLYAPLSLYVSEHIVDCAKSLCLTP